MSDHLPPLHGLVLAGGHSRRFGQDKGSFRPAPDEEPLALRALQLLKPFCQRRLLSLRPGQVIDWVIPPDVERCDDCFGESGPLGALLSAWECAPEAAWLVVACDLAVLDSEALAILVNGRKSLRPATAFAHPGDGKPEPLCAIYEPFAQRILHTALAEGRRSLRRYLEWAVPADALLTPSHPQALMNFNTLADFDHS